MGSQHAHRLTSTQAAHPSRNSWRDWYARFGRSAGSPMHTVTGRVAIGVHGPPRWPCRRLATAPQRWKDGQDITYQSSRAFLGRMDVTSLRFSSLAHKEAGDVQQPHADLAIGELLRRPSSDPSASRSLVRRSRETTLDRAALDRWNRETATSALAGTPTSTSTTPKTSPGAPGVASVCVSGGRSAYRRNRR